MDEIKLPEQINDIKRLIDAGYPVLNLVSWEEKRVTDHIMMLCSLLLKPERQFFTWSITDGFSDGPNGSGAAKGDPIKALDQVINSTEPSLYLLRDFHPFIANNQEVVRKIRDVYQYCNDTQKAVVFLSPVVKVPPELQKDIFVIDYPLPMLDEIEAIVLEEIGRFSAEKARHVPMVDDANRESLIRSFLGLTQEEIVKCVRKILLSRSEFGYEDVDFILEEKRQILRKSEILEFIRNDIRMTDVGGLRVFKRWVQRRRKGFSEAARKYGLPQPKGLLITGISGCGKSLAIQALANQWKLPLLRLDMGRVFGGFAGSPEESMRRAIMTVEAVAPAVLWIDEIEMGISVFSDSVESGSTSRIFSSFLTWMQEKKAPVFIAATANDIDRLPPEMIRKGRFDEVFFVDLPDQEEREAIFKIHLSNRGKEITDISLQNLAHHAEGFTGAEIEQCIVNAMYDCFALEKNLAISDIYKSMGRTVPLSITMKEQITKTKRWADSRAVKASGNKPPSGKNSTT